MTHTLRVTGATIFFVTAPFTTRTVKSFMLRRYGWRQRHSINGARRNYIVLTFRRKLVK